VIISSIKREVETSDDSKRRVAEARAKRYLTEGWIPIVPEVLRNVRKNLREGMYGDPRSIIGDLMQDPALFNFCLREAQYHNGARKQTDIFEHLVKVPVSEWHRLLPSLEGNASRHKLTQATQEQLMLMRQVGIAATATELLAQGEKMKPLIGFQTAVVRQLGLLLVAFNYPRIFAKAWEAHSSSPQKLEESLFRALGFSPLRMGTQVAEGWGVSNDMSGAVSDMRPDEWVHLLSRRKDDGDQARISLRELCCLGEGFASIHARGGAHYSDAAGILEQELERRLGKDVYQTLIDETTDLCERYGGGEKAARVPATTDKPIEGRSEGGETIVGSVSDRCREIAARVVKALVPNAPSAIALKMIVEELVPAAEFDGGCIYVLARDSLMPKPQLFIGVERSSFRPVFECSLGLTVDPMTRACVEKSTVRGQVLHGTPNPTIYLAAPLGGDGKRAALYLESSANTYLEGHEKVEVAFQLICDLLVAALNLPNEVESKSGVRTK